MPLLIAGLALFFAAHSIAIVAPFWRDRMVLLVGQLQWKGLYALTASVGFVALVCGYALAHQTPIIVYAPPLWLRYATFILMLPVFPLALAAYLPGRIQSATRHPLLAATTLWAGAHMLADGSLAAVLLFGSFLAWASIDQISLRRRHTLPLQAQPASGFNDAIAVAVGIALYLVFAWRLHRWLIGVQPHL
jgi:uncharacterized membrane protein